MRELYNLSLEIHEIAKSKGWWDEERGFGEVLMLIVTELSEAMELYREGEGIQEYWIDEEKGKPEGIPIELADAFIRLADLCARYDIDLELFTRMKMVYNKNRPYRHGNKVA